MGIREIKDRLNIAFALYESLKQKFGEQIEFEKCAIVAYLTTEFEKAFHATDDHAFQNLVYAYLRNDLSDAKIDEILPDTDSDYKKEVQELIAAKKSITIIGFIFTTTPKMAAFCQLMRQLFNMRYYMEKAQNITNIRGEGSAVWIYHY